MTTKLLIAPICEIACVQLIGRDARKFLNNFCTANLLVTPEDVPQELMLLNPKGHVLAWGWAMPLEEGLGLLLSGLGANEVCQHLDAYLFSEQVVISTWDISCWWMAAAANLASIAGPEDTVRSGVFLSPVNHKRESESNLFSPCEVWRIAGGAYFGFCPTPASPETQFPKPQFPEPELPESLQRLFREIASEEFSDSDIQFVTDRREFHRWRISNGLPIIGQDTVATTLPQEILRNEQAISFTKGCYLGQETVARLDAMGHVNWNLRVITFDHSWPLDKVDPQSARPIPNAQIYSDNQAIGQLTSVCDRVGLVRIRATSAAHFSESKGSWQIRLDDGQVVPLQIENLS